MKNNYSLIRWLLNSMMFFLVSVISLTGFGYMKLDRYQVHMTVLLILCLFTLSYSSKYYSWGIKLDFEKVLFFMFLVMIIMSISWSYDANLTRKYSIYFVLYAIILTFEYTENICYKFVVLLKNTAVFNAITVLLSLILKDTYLRMFGFLYDDKSGVWNMLSQGLGTGITGVSSYAAYIISIGLGFYISKIFVARKLTRQEMLSAVVCLLGILATGKRTILIGIVLATVIMAVFSVDKKKISTLLKYSSLVVVIIILAITFVPQVQVTVTRFADAVGDKDLNNRRIFWQNAIVLFMKNPIKGCGFGSYSSFDKYEGTGYGYSTHNIYLETMTELGIIGISLLALFLGSVLYKTVKLLRSKVIINDYRSSICAHFIFYGVLIYMFYGIMETPMYSFSLQFVFILLVGMMGSLFRKIGNTKALTIRFF